MSHNTWLHRTVRTVVTPLAKTPVTPNHITTLRIAAGLTACLLLAIGPQWHVMGALFFLLSMLLDRADGELARMTGKTTPWGHTYDLISDALCNTLVFVGLGIGLKDSSLGNWAIMMGLLAGFGVSFILWLVIQTEKLQGARAAELESFAGFDPDDGMLAIPVALLLGWNTPLLLAASIGAPGFAIFMWYRQRETLEQARGE